MTTNDDTVLSDEHELTEVAHMLVKLQFRSDLSLRALRDEIDRLLAEHKVPHSLLDEDCMTAEDYDRLQAEGRSRRV
jgi:hypothetical protein